jgi:hypothetical protein
VDAKVPQFSRHRSLFSQRGKKSGGDWPSILEQIPVQRTGE